MGFEAPVHKEYFDAIDRGPDALHRADPGPRRPRGRRRLLPRAGHRDRRAREQRRPAGLRRAPRAVPGAAQRLRVRRGVRAHGGRGRGGDAARAVASDADHHLRGPLRVHARRRALRADRLSRRRDRGLARRLAPRAPHLFHRQRLRRALRPLSEPRHHPRRPPSRRAPLRRDARPPDRARRGDAARRPLRSGRGARP